MGESFIESAESVEDECPIGDRVPDVTKSVCQLSEHLTVGGDSQIALESC